LLRNVEKKSGQEELVKLLPIEVSKGVGIGVVITVTDGAVEVDTPAVGEPADVSVLISTAVSVDAEEVIVESEDDDEDVLTGDEVDVEEIVVGTTLSPTCRRSRYVFGLAGGVRRSICISPLAASS
jgi:hypothetical protein